MKFIALYCVHYAEFCQLLGAKEESHHSTEVRHWKLAIAVQKLPECCASGTVGVTS